MVSKMDAINRKQEDNTSREMVAVKLISGAAIGFPFLLAKGRKPHMRQQSGGNVQMPVIPLQSNEDLLTAATRLPAMGNSRKTLTPAPEAVVTSIFPFSACTRVRKLAIPIPA